MILTVDIRRLPVALILMMAEEMIAVYAIYQYSDHNHECDSA